MISFEKLESITLESASLRHFSDLKIALYAKDVSGTYLAANDYCKRLSGMTGSLDLLGQLDEECLWRGAAHQLRVHDERVMRDRLALLFVEPIANARGQVFHFLSHKMPMIDADGEVVGVFGVSVLADGAKAADFFNAVTEVMKLFEADNSASATGHALQARKAAVRQSLLRRLTPRERECIDCLSKGLSAKETARELGLSYRTIEVYFEKIKAKFGCTRKSEVLQLLFADA